MKTIDTLSPGQARAAELLRALGNPARVAIVHELAQRTTCVTGDLVEALPLAQSTVSQHLKVLKEAGIVQGVVEGDVCYCIDPEPLQWLAGYLGDLATGGCAVTEPSPGEACC